MAAINNALRRSSTNRDGVLGDADLTPKPLRIAKRESLGSPTSRTSSTLPFFSPVIPASPTHLNLVPATRSYQVASGTQLDLSLREGDASTSQWTRRNTFLHVHKQRRSEPIRTSTGALYLVPQESIGSVSRAPAGRPHVSCPPIMVDVENRCDASKANGAVKLPSARAFSTGTFKKVKPSSSLNESPLLSSSPSTLNKSRRRAVTSDSCHKNLDEAVDTSDHVLRKQPSFKTRLMSRVMSGLTNRIHTNQALAQGNQGPQVPCNSTKATFSSHIEDANTVRRNFSNAETGTYCRSDLDGALSAFPMPPTSNLTSPTTAGSSFAFSSSEIPPMSRNLCMPKETVMIGAELNLIPENDELGFENGKSMFVAIDVKGVMNAAGGGEDVWSQHTGLDVVVILDNSLYTSPAALMASCETARFLASILSPVTDRIAILCTSPYSTASEPSIISSLAQIKTHKLKTALDAIESSQEKPTTAAWETVIEDAKEMLLQSTLPDPDTEPRLDTFGHIFIFTANTHEIPAGSLIHDKLQFHIIRPAILARSDLRSLDCNGWKLGSSSESEPQAVSARKDTDPISLFNRLRALVAHSRSGKILGNMSGLRLDIKPGPGCSVEGVMGETYYPALYPGELLTILVKLRIRTTASQGYLLPNAPSQSITSPHSADIMGELDKMLGISGTSILSVKVRYEHSLLPAGTTCAVISECRLKRGLPDSDQKPSPQKPMSLRTKAFKSLVQQRLAYYLATHGTPKDALSNLRHEFGEKYHRSICPQYINLITRELKYQDRIAERLTIDASPKKRVRSPSPRPNDAFEPFVQGLFGPEIHKSQNLTANVADDEEGYSSIAPRPSLVASLRTSRTELRTDEARKIWGDMRRVSRPPNQVLNGRSVSSTVEANRRNNIRELAMRNKRSIGTDTLRSITSAGESMGKGLGAPWM